MSRWNVLRHHRSGSDYSPVSDRDAFQDNRSRADKYAAPDHNRPCYLAANVAIIAPPPLTHGDMKIVVHHHRPGAKDRSFPDAN
jgi:hypothetical protein